MREYLINADFDLSLRPGRRSETADGRARQALEMPHHLLLLGVDGDSVLVDQPPDGDYLAYLERAGLPRPSTTVVPQVTPDAQFVPFGWNEEAVELSGSYTAPASHPPLGVVRRVNGRRFAAKIERELFDVEEVLGVFEAPAEIEAFVDAVPVGEEWLVKSEHGNAGLGNRRLRSRILTESDREVMRRLLAEDVCVLLETWRRRVIDISTVFMVNNGAVADLQVYEVVNTADGAYIGSFFGGFNRNLEDWRLYLGEVASKVARRLSDEGYFGPVCLDHFVWSDGDQQHLRPLADLNARLQVSAPMLRLWRAWGGDRVLYWRLFAARKLRLPTDYRELEKALGSDAFDAGERRGIVVTSPFQVAGRRLRRFGVLLSGTSRVEVEEMDRRLRGRFEKCTSN
jgi:hypothetical protein